MIVMEARQFWTAFSAQKKINSRFEIVEAPMKKEKSAGVVSIPAELVPAGGKTTKARSKDWSTGEWPTP